MGYVTPRLTYSLLIFLATHLQPSTNLLNMSDREVIRRYAPKYSALPINQKLAINHTFFCHSRKIVIVGDGACGKTSLLYVFTLGEFPTVCL